MQVKKIFRSPRGLCILVLLLLGIIIHAILFYRYSEHLKWVFFEAALYSEIKRTPSTKLLTSPHPETWVEHEIDGFRLKVPSEMGISQGDTFDKNKKIEFRSENKRFRIKGPFKNDNKSRYSRIDSSAQHKLKVYKADSSDFSWSMSKIELNKHRKLMIESTLVRTLPIDNIEYTFRDDLDGLLLIKQGSFASFEWNTNDGANYGNILFGIRNDADLIWVRKICLSVTWENPL